MGTRADFYVGRGETAEWLGSTAWDGDPSGIPETIRIAEDETTYRAAVLNHIQERDDGTEVWQGWPWPWKDSNTTDFAYAFENGTVYGNSFGYGWFDAGPGEYSDDDWDRKDKGTVFPNMEHVQAIDLGERSGLMIVSRKDPEEE